ncbi:hybrid sensor histidine kinase/response regulator [Niastella yeongjuensis]|uniref:histidine kinase n=1 Tax=Niastella yeongjuensis TaxID=354355 RepID=A0A1V9EES3_9BACT|nr:response regulator [Niastella yeongjuensis]OQP44551.1 hybrid sensor histidine kinase/response regulator [Niastella yeongjuensis]SEO83777.1 His Kinase A (phospho-acceptor) domain-containing protein [Niastella yeongjuensis]
MILIVDDKYENLFSLKTLLQLYAYETDTAASGEEALKKILKNEYSVIILDVQMPDMDGYEVAEAISGLNKTRDIPIIFLSAVNIDKRFIAKGYDSGGVDYITKPFDNDLLLLKVRTFYRLSQQRKELKMVEEALRREIDMRKKSQAEVEEINSLLEFKVEERTRDLTQLNKDLENRNAELAQYAYLASHDLQEPLRKIITFIKIIDDKYLAGIPEAKQEITKVITSAERMRNLINALLSYSKLSAVSYFTPVNLNDIIKDALADLELAVKDKQAIIQVTTLPEVEGIAAQMRQLFMNLLSNALKFSKTTIQPQIKIYCEPVDELSLEAAPVKTGRYVRIHCSDNGIGLDESYIDKIFVIFQRLHGRTQYEGTGIGLAIVKKIVEKHNGLIGVKSHEGEGATFTIVLPLKQSNNTN